ncbi:MAG: insulinase family protein [Clostridia bacterium]|nr:insulinase family protein [Clostridia bacterium]
MENLKSYDIKHGIRLFYIPAKKFKTAAMSVNFHRALKKEEASFNALLADVMRRGCAKYPDQASVMKLRQELYGAYFDVDVRRKGEDQILSFSISAVNERFLPEGETAFTGALDLLFEMILNPLVADGAFKAEYVEQEKVNLKNDIDAVINDKRAYATWRLIELMCKDEPYGVHELGDKESIDKITAESLYSHYEKVMSEGPVDVFVTGDVDIENIINVVKDKFSNITLTKTELPKAEIHKPAETETEIVEAFDVTQAKLCVGYSTGIMPTDADYPALMVYNGILGSGAHSKLFNNVREKLSLAYYAASRLDRYKGMMVVSSGIEIANKQKALDEINVQLEDIKNGKISDYEFDATMKSIINALRALGDDIGYLEDYYLGQALSGTSLSLEDHIKLIEKVTVDDVVRVAKHIKPEMVYFLTGKEGK